MHDDKKTPAEHGNESCVLQVFLGYGGVSAWQKEPVPCRDMYDKWFNFDQPFPTLPGKDTNKVDYFYYRGKCYGSGTIVLLKENAFYHHYRLADYSGIQIHCNRDLHELTEDHPRVKKNLKPYYAEFRLGWANGAYIFRHVKTLNRKVSDENRLGREESHCFDLEDYIEEIIDPIYVYRPEGSMSLVGNCKMMPEWKKDKLKNEFTLVAFYFVPFVFLTLFTRAHETWFCLLAAAIYVFIRLIWESSCNGF